MSTPPAMTKTTTSATTIRARAVLTRTASFHCHVRARARAVSDDLAVEGGRPSPVEAGGDRIVECRRVGRERPRPQLNDVCMAMDRAGAEGEGGERRPQSRAEPPQGERTNQRDRQLACRAEQQQGRRGDDGTPARNRLDRLLGGKARELDRVQGGDEAHERGGSLRLDVAVCHDASRTDDE